MTTERYEAFALEEGDTIVRGDDLFVITSIEIEGDQYCLNLVDENGYARHLLLGEFDKVRVAVDPYVEA